MSQLHRLKAKWPSIIPIILHTQIEPCITSVVFLKKSVTYCVLIMSFYAVCIIQSLKMLFIN